MMLKRLFPVRWARITAWTGAALAWGTAAIAVASAANSPAPESEPALPLAIEPSTTTSAVTTTLAPVPELPERGLVVVRYTPAPPPPPQVVTRTVVVAGPSGGDGAATSAPAAPAPAAPVQSSGS